MFKLLIRRQEQRNMGMGTRGNKPKGKKSKKNTGQFYHITNYRDVNYLNTSIKKQRVNG